MPGRLATHRHPRINTQAAVANNLALSAAEALRLHWPEYLMEAVELACTFSRRARWLLRA